MSTWFLHIVTISCFTACKHGLLRRHRQKEQAKALHSNENLLTNSLPVIIRMTDMLCWEPICRSLTPSARHALVWMKGSLYNTSVIWVLTVAL